MHTKKITVLKNGMYNFLTVMLTTSVFMGGTFAWQSLDQEALNETSGEFWVGGRLHTDFDGVSKNIYIENFRDQEQDGYFFARVRLEEYMEIGEDAGEKDPDLMNVDVYKLGGVATDINDVDTWDIIYLQDNGVLNGISEIRNYIKLHGGGQAIYMPTFNKNLDSRLSDINGTLAGPDNIDKTLEDAYHDFVLYNLDGSNDGITEKTAIATYDYDDDDIEEEDPVIATDTDMIEDADVYQVEETHYSKLTATGTIITMRDWMAQGSPTGEYWVFDTDGWAYWAQPIYSDTATGLILNKIEVHTMIEETCYYEINARAQYATKGDWGAPHNDTEEATGFYVDGITENALALLDSISKPNE